MVGLFVLFPIGIYFWVGFKKESRAHTVLEYFLANQEVSAEDYANTSVGYGLQMASLFLFADWGMRYGFGALWVPVFWAGGFWLLLRMLHRFHVFHSSKVTLHGYLRKSFGNSVALQRLAAGSTIIGLGGTMMAEIDYTLLVFGPLNIPSGYLFAGVLVFGTGYIIVNGFKAEVVTERYQVPAAYTCLIGTLLFLLPVVWEASSETSFAAIATLLIAALGLVVLGKSLTLERWSEVFGSFHFRMLAAASFVILVEVFFLKAHTPHGQVAILTAPLSTQVEAQGIVSLVSLFIANFLWMVVDISTWQRIASVKSTTGRDFPLESLKKGTRRVLFESPATWLLGVVLGWMMAAILPNGTEPSTGITKLMDAMANGGSRPGGHPILPPELMTYFVYPAFAAACVAVMLTTVNALVSTISFTLFADIFADGDLSGIGTIHEEKRRLRRAQVLTAVSVVLGALAYPTAKAALGNSLPTVLYTAYAAQLSLFVVAVIALWQVNCRRVAALVSLTSGLGMSVACGILSGLNPTNLSLGVMPPLFGVIGAFVGYVITYKFESRTPPTSSVAA